MQTKFKFKKAAALLLVVFLICTTFALTLSVSALGLVKVKTLKYSSDYSTISVAYGANSYKIYRPVTNAPKTFKAAKGGKYLYVSTKGKDTNKGTSSKPYKTISKAVAVAKAGDVIYVKAGTYTEHIIMKNSGTSTKPIVVSAAPGQMGKVTVTPDKKFIEANQTDADIAAVFDLKGRYITINGLIIQGPRGRSEAPINQGMGGYGVFFDTGSDYSKATNNIIYYTCSTAIISRGGTNSNTVKGNTIFECGTSSSGDGVYLKGPNAVIDGNVIFKVFGAGIYVNDSSNAKNALIQRNLVFGCADAGIYATNEAAKVYNNTVTGCFFGILVFPYDGPSDKGTVVKNNVVAYNSSGSGACEFFTIKESMNDITVSNNILYTGSNVAAIQNGNKIKHLSSNINKNPQFVNKNSGNFKLKSSSPAINKGAKVGLSYKGKAPDLGCYEMK